MRVTLSGSARVGHTAELSGTRDSQLGSFLAPLRGALVLDAVFVSVLCGVTHGFVIVAFAVSRVSAQLRVTSLVSVVVGPRERAHTSCSGSDSHEINEAVIAAQRH